MAITQKFAYAAEYKHYKEAIKSDSTKFNDSIVFTGDGYIISRGNVIKGTKLNGDVDTNNYGLHFDKITRTVTFKDEGGTAADKTITLPDASGDKIVIISYDSNDNKYVASHKTYADTDPAQITGSTSLTNIVGVGTLNWDKYGHVVSASQINFDAAQVKQNKFAATSGNLVISGSSTEAEDTEGHLNKTKVVITNDASSSSISGVKDITATGNIKAGTLYEGENSLSNIYVKSTTYASGTKLGVVKLSDDIDKSGNDYKSTASTTYAATPYAVYAALEEAKKHANQLNNTTVGNIAGAFIYKGTVTAEADLKLAEAKAGYVYVVSVGFTFASATNLANSDDPLTVEPGDMIIATGDNILKWSVIQRNIDGAVTASTEFTTTPGLIGNNSKGRGVKQINLESGHLTISGDKLLLATVSNNNKTHENITSWTLSTGSSTYTIKVPGITIDNYGRVTKLDSTSYIIQAQYSLPAASTTIGGIALFDANSKTLSDSKTPSTSFAASLADRAYALLKDSNNKGFVLIPWIEAIAGDGLANTDNSLTRTFKVKAADNSINVSSSGIKVNTGDNLEISSNKLIVKTAQTSVTGAVKVVAVHGTVAYTGTDYIPSSDNTTTGYKTKCYGLQLDKNGTAFVHVPWTDSQTLTQTITKKTNNSIDYAEVSYLVSGDTAKTFNIKGDGSAKIGVSGTDITITADTNTWRAINAYKCKEDSKSLILNSTGTVPLTFSRDFCWHNEEITICWAEIASDGTVTYK